MPQSPDPRHQPMFNIPPATMGLLLANIAMHLVRAVLPTDLDDAVVDAFAFIPARYATPGELGWAAIVAPVSYQFLHGSWAHLGINMVALLAFGSGVEQRIGAIRMLLFYLLCGVAAAAVHFAVYPTSPMAVIGASGAISGQFGAVLRIRVATGARGLWLLIVLWIIMNVVGGQMGMPGEENMPIAWVAHIGGFLAGLAAIGLFLPPARQRLRPH